MDLTDYSAELSQRLMECHNEYDTFNLLNNYPLPEEPGLLNQVLFMAYSNYKSLPKKSLLQIGWLSLAQKAYTKLLQDYPLFQSDAVVSCRELKIINVQDEVNKYNKIMISRGIIAIVLGIFFLGMAAYIFYKAICIFISL